MIKVQWISLNITDFSRSVGFKVDQGEYLRFFVTNITTEAQKHSSSNITNLTSIRLSPLKIGILKYRLFHKTLPIFSAFVN